MADRAWLMLAYGDDRAYGGNQGYSDSTDRYSYDSRVPNWKQVSAGDLAVIGGRLRPRGAPEVSGFARVQRVTTEPATKLVRRCPQCGHPRFKARATKTPRWRCDRGHEFDDPAEEVVPVTGAVAWFDDTYRPAIGAMTAEQLRDSQLNRGDGNSIRPLDPPFVRRSFLWDADLTPIIDPGGYPDPAAAAKVNRVAIPLALAIIQARFPGATVQPQDHANPGFDFLVTAKEALVRYVELKSTVTTPGSFYASEYQRVFSERHRGLFSLLVLTGLDLERRICSHHWFDGAIDDHFQLAPIQWRGVL
jgi:hypothetical protein